MLRKSFTLSLLSASLLVASVASAYQVTGEVKEVTPDKVTVMKGKEKFEMARTPDTKLNGDVKVGSKVTAEYTLVVKSVDVKDAKTAKADKAVKASSAKAK